jgi:hypothetical protein
MTLVASANFPFKNRRPFVAHDPRGAILPVQRVRKLSTPMNVELVGGQEVFAQRMEDISITEQCD